MKLVYFSEVRSVSQYSIKAWGEAFRSLLKHLTVIQEAILKAALHNSGRYPSESLFRDTFVLTVRQLFIKLFLIETFQHE